MKIPTELAFGLWFSVERSSTTVNTDADIARLTSPNSKDNAQSSHPKILCLDELIEMAFSAFEALPTQIDDAKIKNQSQYANHRSHDHIPDDQPDKKWNRTPI